jgi:hypothetical protein
MEHFSIYTQQLLKKTQYFHSSQQLQWNSKWNSSTSDPIRSPAVAAVIGSAGPPQILAVAAIDEETMLDFTNRKSEHRWLYGNVEKDNKAFNDGVTDIIKEVQRITMEMTQVELNNHIIIRNIPGLLTQFREKARNTKILLVLLLWTN